MLIGITGTDGAGKGSVVSYLVSHYGFVHYSSRAMILEHVRREGLPETRNQMRLTANAWREREGDDVLVKTALERMAMSVVPERAIIESIRTLAESTTLHSAGGILLAVDADPHTRYDRVQMRRSESDKISFDEFMSQEALEKNDPNPHGMQKARVMEIADYTIMNNGTLEELYSSVDEFLKNMSSDR
jgi:dephospho-CoA kinase